MNREAVCARIQEVGIIPAIRLSSAEDAIFAAEAVAESGIPIVEVTMTVPGAVGVIGQLAQRNSGLLIGGGTVLDIEAARRCLDAGAHFITSPGLAEDIVDFARKNDMVVFPGALTPTEIMLAWKQGADFVKVFPSSLMGGANYVRALKSPFPQIPLIAAGGVNQDTAADFIHAGAVALGVGRELIPTDAVRRRQPDWIRELAGRFLKTIAQARTENGE